MLIIVLTGIMLLVFSLVCASANQILRLPSFFLPTLTHPAAPGEKGEGEPQVWWLVRLLLDLLRRMAQQKILPHQICGSRRNEKRSYDRGSFHLPSGDPSGAVIEWLEHPPRAAVTQGNDTSGETFRNKRSARSAYLHTGQTNFMGARDTLLY